MRIALVTETFFPAVDGTTTTVKAVADRLVRTGPGPCSEPVPGSWPRAPGTTGSTSS